MRRRPLGLDVTGARLEDVEAGHEIEGPAIVEHVATTFAISPGRSAGLDGQGIFHLGAPGYGPLRSALARRPPTATSLVDRVAAAA